MDAKAWSEHIAALAVDELVERGLVRKEEFDRAVVIVAEEIFVRLSLRDTPSPVDPA